MNPLTHLLIDALGRRRDNFDWRGREPSLDLWKTESVCLLQPNHKLGDAILISLLVDALSQARPELPIHVATSPSFVPYWSAHRAVSQTIVLDPGKHRPVWARAAGGWREGRSWRGRLDVAVSFQPFARAEHFALLRYLRPRTLIGFNKDPYRLFDYSLEEHRQGVDLAPTAMRARSVMRLFGQDVDVHDLQAHVPYGPEDEARIRRTLRDLPNGPRVLVNAYGATRRKRLAPESVRHVVREIRLAGQVATVVSAPPGEERTYAIALASEPNVAVIGPQEGFGPLCALVAAMDAVISPDTAVGHIAAALGKPQVCLFGQRGNVEVTWKPLNDRCIALAPTKGDGVDGIDKAELGEAVRRLLSSIGRSRPTESCAPSSRRRGTG